MNAFAEPFEKHARAKHQEGILEATAPEDDVLVVRYRRDICCKMRQRIMKLGGADGDGHTIFNVIRQASNHGPPVAAPYATFVDPRFD
jgi:hypothetical protein